MVAGADGPAWCVGLEHRPPPFAGKARSRGEARCELALDGLRVVRRFGRVGEPLVERCEAFDGRDEARRSFDRQLTRLMDRGYRPGAESEGHLSAIARAFDDREARRSYARWLTERGDPRGPLIVRHLEGADAEAAQWVARHPGLMLRSGVQYLGEVRWHLGFVDAVQVDTSAVANPDMVALATALRRLLAHPSGLLVRRVALEGLGIVRQGCPVVAALEASRAPALAEVRLGYLPRSRRQADSDVIVAADEVRLRSALPAARCDIEVSDPVVERPVHHWVRHGSPLRAPRVAPPRWQFWRQFWRR